MPSWKRWVHYFRGRDDDLMRDRAKGGSDGKRKCSPEVMLSGGESNAAAQ